mgnify:CR=1 FL=1
MAFFYDLNFAFTSNGTANTETDHMRLLTVANQETCRIVGLYGASRFGTAGGAAFGWPGIAAAGLPELLRNVYAVGRNPAGLTRALSGAGQAGRVGLGTALERE